MLTVEGADDGYRHLSRIAKRNFLSRERDYLKTKPLSDDLRLFIRRQRRRAPVFLAKYKRNDEAKEPEHMFVVDNGNIVPLDNMTDVTAVPNANPSELGNFTVIPLVIPITVKMFTNATLCRNETSDSSEDDVRSTESLRQSDKRTAVEEQVVEKPVKLAEREEPKPPPTSPKTTKETTPSTELIIENALSTLKSDSMRFLNKVLNDVQDLISYEKEGKSTGNNEGAMCTVIGDWDTNAGGMQLQISLRNESLNSPKVEVVEQEPAAEKGFLRACQWNITSYMPFNHSSLMILTAVSDKSVASFIGDCRICQGAETITGSWMVARRSADCKDRQQTHSFFSDVMRKSNIRRLQKEHLDELSTKDLVTTTEF
ncbi:hypothetical protein NQ315_006476 [Exocentrus adspersus]|uniref:Uncharacterized protein n=1 Tax=Exocentrus adspersus TaxID=1586481 RepID=A0AAV8W132_9CUCU|nr:hypothetical protein NQ315_006476 [Exocentrus adspersus]